MINAVAGIIGLLSFTGCLRLQENGAAGAVAVKDGQTVAFLGDSITAGGAEYGKYCRLVVQGLKAKGICVKPILAGVSGNTSAHMLARLDKDVLRYKPDWVVLACGVNDVWHTDPTAKIGVFQPKPGMGVELDDYKKNVREIVQRCEAAGARVLLTTITPIREDSETNLNIKARDYNAFLLELGRERNLPIARLNEAMFAEIAKGRRLTSDGVHPLVEGDRVMAKGILQALGISKEETDAMEQEWENSPAVLVLGDRQTTSGSRPGGWCQLLADGLNSGREMVTLRFSANYRNEVTVSDMLKGFCNLAEVKDRFVIIQATRGDAIAGTPLTEYRKTVETLVAAICDKGSKPVLVTIPVQDNDPDGELSQTLTPYNEILRAVAAEEKVPLADMNQAMVAEHASEPNVRLTFDGERFNRQGSVLMAETILRATGQEERLTPELRRIWKERGFYAE